MKRFLKKMFKKYEHIANTSVIGSYSLYNTEKFEKECKEFIQNEFLPSVLPKVEYNEKDTDRKSPYHQYYIKRLLLHKFSEILEHELEARYKLQYPEKSYRNAGLRD